MPLLGGLEQAAAPGPAWVRADPTAPRPSPALFPLGFHPVGDVPRALRLAPLLLDCREVRWLCKENALFI